MALPQFDTQAFATNPQQWIQPYGQGLAGLAAQQLGRPIDTGAMTAGVAGPGAFTQAGQQLTADMGGLGDISRDATGQISGFTGGTGIASFQPYLQSIKDKGLLDPTGYQAYMSPYQQQVIDTTLAEFDKQAQIGKFGLGKSASDAGAFGGARHGIAQSEYQLGSDANRAAIQAGLLQGGFGQAQTLQQQGLQNLTGMAQLVPGLQQGLGQQFGAMGGQENTYAQALQNQMAAQNQMAMNYPMQRIGQAANIFGTTAGQVPGAPVQPFQGSGTYAGIGAFGNLQSLMGART
jgi:hypothetical protein